MFAIGEIKVSLEFKQICLANMSTVLWQYAIQWPVNGRGMHDQCSLVFSLYWIPLLGDYRDAYKKFNAVQ